MNVKLFRPVLAGFALLLVQACTTTGNPSIAEESRESISEILREGVTSKDEVRNVLGDPIDSTFIDDGKEVWTYERSRITPKATNFIPYVQILASGTDKVEQKLTILFDHEDIVEKYTWSESEVETRTGILVRPLASTAEP